MNDGFQNGGPFGMATLWNGGPEPTQRAVEMLHEIALYKLTVDIDTDVRLE